MQLFSRSKPSATVVPGVQTQIRAANIRKGLTIIAFLLPSALIYFALVILPIFQAAFYSLFTWNGLTPLSDFVGLDNYARAIQDSVFLRAVGNNVLVAALSACLQLPIALGLALLIRRRMRGRTIFRMIFFLPYVLSEVVTGVLWSFIYQPQTGLLNNLLESVIPGFTRQGWLGDTQSVLLWLFVVITWKYFGLYLMLFTAGLQNIPAELEEAALIDGANGSQVIRHVTIPLLKPTLRLALFLSVIGSLQLFDLIWVMTKGGPVNASETMATYMYNFGFRRFALGYGSAVAVVLFVLAFGFSIIYQRYVMRRDYT